MICTYSKHWGCWITSLLLMCCCYSYRTAYYHTLARLLFMEDTPSRFRDFMLPLQQVCHQLLGLFTLQEVLPTLGCTCSEHPEPIFNFIRSQHACVRHLTGCVARVCTCDSAPQCMPW